MEVNLSKRQAYFLSVILGILLFMISIFVNLIGMYYDDEVILACSNGSTERYNKTDLNNINTVCSDVNIYKYNDNDGLGVYFPNKLKINIAISEYENNLNQ